MTGLFNAGIYVRLSLEDVKNRSKAKSHITSGDSVSIENQKDFLIAHAEKMGWFVKKVYADDGYSGGTFDRPAFKEMLEDVKNGLINLILVKDLSRFGRNYIEVGQYTETILPSLGCRFVALSDSIDTAFDNNDMMHFRSLLNDHYLKDISGKIKAVHKAKAKSGKMTGGFAPYGYKKSTDGSQQLLIDEYAAGIVRRIFELRQTPMGYASIAGILNNEGILSPRGYRYRCNGKENPYKGEPIWLVKAVKNILKSEYYLGNIVQMRTGSISYRTKQVKPRAKEEWIKVENTHEPIIDRAIWDAVQQIDLCLCDPQKCRPSRTSLFQGLLVCDECGSSFSVTMGQKPTHANRYQCSRYAQTAHGYCSSHRVREDDLIQLVLGDIKRHAKIIELHEDEMLAELTKMLGCDNSIRQLEIKNELKKSKAKLTELETVMGSLYEDKVGGVITEETFAMLIATNQREITTYKEKQLRLLAEQTETELALGNIGTWVGLIRKYAEFDTLDRELLTTLVDKIQVGRNETVDGMKQQDITIVYKFVGQVK